MFEAAYIASLSSPRSISHVFFFSAYMTEGNCDLLTKPAKTKAIEKARFYRFVYILGANRLLHSNAIRQSVCVSLKGNDRVCVDRLKQTLLFDISTLNQNWSYVTRKNRSLSFLVSY